MVDIIPIKRHLQLLTVSAAREYRRCPRAYQYTYVDMRRPTATSMPLRFGSLWHNALEEWRIAKMLGKPESEILQAGRAAIEAFESDPFEAAKAHALLWGYHARYIDEPETYAFVEQEFSMPLVNPETKRESRTYQLAGKIDAGVHRADGFYIVESKTSSEDITLGSPYWQRLQIDSQISTYIEGAKSLGFNPVGCLYDVVRRPGLRPLKANSLRSRDETPDEYRERVAFDISQEGDKYFVRGTIARLEGELYEAAFDTWHTARAITTAAQMNTFTRNVDSCMRFNTPCAYWKVCAGELSLDDDNYFRSAERPHEELEKENNHECSSGTKASA